MKKLYTFGLTVALSLGLAAASALASGGNTTTGTIGSTVENFTLPDASGAKRSLDSLKGKRGTVLIFVSTRCPVSNAYNSRMEKLARQYRERGVNVVGINSNVAETSDEIKKHSAENKFSFPVLKDAGNRIADRLDAKVTPEVYFLDASNRLVYRGRIDDSRNGDSINSEDLRDALEAVLAGKSVEKTEARAFGCTIKRAS